MSTEILAELEAATRRINAFTASMEAGNQPDATAIADVMSDVGTFASVTMTMFQALTELMGQIDKGEFRDALGQDLKLNEHYLYAKKLLGA